MNLNSNLKLQGASLLSHCALFLDPFARLLGLDGVILISFILALPANEIFIPITIMAYSSVSSLTDHSSLSELSELFVANGWTMKTALCVMLFSLFHWPCITTLLTIKKESGGVKWALLAAAIPTALGILLCATVNLLSALF